MDWLGSVAAESQTLGASAAHVAPRLLAAALLGGILAWRPWQRRGRPKLEIAQTQLLMCVAAALIVTVIGDSVARAFGVVGLGGFIRFRTGIKDPRDAAVLFLLIGVGMAAGLGMYELATAGAGTIALVLVGLDRAGRPRPATERMRLLVEAEDAGRAEAAFAAALGPQGYRVIATRPGPGASRVVIDAEGPEGLASAWDRRGRKVGRLLSWERLAAAPAETGGERAA